MCVLRTSARDDANLHWLRLSDFSSLCAFKCLLKSPAWSLVTLSAFVLLIFLSCVFSNASLNPLLAKMQSCTGCICLTFFHLMSLNMSSKHLHASMQFAHWLHVLNFSPLCVFRCVSIFRTYPVSRSVWSGGDDNGHDQISTVSDVWLIFWALASSFKVTLIRLDQSMHNQTGCICLTFLRCVFWNMSS